MGGPRTVAVATLLAVGGGLVAPATAAAARRTPLPPTHVHVTKVTATSFTASARHSAYAHKYRIFASFRKRRISVVQLRAHRLKHVYVSKVTRHPRVTLDHLHFTTKQYFYRMEALNGKKNRFSDIRSVGLAPAVPVLRSSSSVLGTWLTWSGSTAANFQIVQSTDASLQQNRIIYAVSGPGEQFTPYHTVKGVTYYFAIRSVNNGTTTPWSNVVHATVIDDTQSVRVLTYNLLLADGDGRLEGDGTVAPWSQRRTGAAHLIEQASPDVIAIQEGASWVNSAQTERQVDDVANELGSNFTVADTEVTKPQPHWFRTGVYIIYNNSEYEAIGNGGHWGLGDSRYAAYQLLQNRQTGARFVMVSPHLQTGNGPGLDAERENEMRNLLNQASSYAASLHVPVIYAGDMNSHAVNAGHSVQFDGPGIMAREKHVADAQAVAQQEVNAQYNSANGYNRTPPAAGVSIDHVYAPPGVAVVSWKLMLDLVNGKFPGTIPSDHNPLVSQLLFPVEDNSSPAPAASPSATPSPTPTPTPTSTPTSS